MSGRESTSAAQSAHSTFLCHPFDAFRHARLFREEAEASAGLRTQRRWRCRRPSAERHRWTCCRTTRTPHQPEMSRTACTRQLHVQRRGDVLKVGQSGRAGKTIGTPSEALYGLRVSALIITLRQCWGEQSDWVRCKEWLQF